MKAFVLFDSLYGNTQKVAEAIGDALRDDFEVEVKVISEVDAANFSPPDLLVVGAPTHKMQPSPPMQEFLRNLPKGCLNGIPVAAFDTRINLEVIESRFFRFIVGKFGFAAGRIEKKLKNKGGEVLVPAAGFAVLDTEGPLLEGEVQRAAAWAREIAAKIPVLAV